MAATATGTYAIKGIPLPPGFPPGQVPLRKDVEQWFATEKEQVTLLVLAMQAFEDLDVQEKTSYFQISGIHGLPYVGWDGVEKPKDGRSFCAHASILFPTFHRPYMLLFEQALYEVMVGKILPDITKNASQDIKARWLTAAQTWRFPFWDWGLSTKVPAIASTETIALSMPDGSFTKPLNNPFYRYSIATGKPFATYGVPNLEWRDKKTGRDFKVLFGESVGTSRNPAAVAGEDWSKGSVQNNQVPISIDRSFKRTDLKPPLDAAEPVKDAVFRLIGNGYFKEYPSFATTYDYHDGKKSTAYLSLEGVHNNLHDGTGGVLNKKAAGYSEGHMAEVPYAAFDPIFWLHHCNVDRLCAIWQDLNSKLWWNSVNENKETITVETKLLPFHTDEKGSLYDSTNARQWIPMNYSYPELQKWLPKYQKEGNFNEQLYIDDLKKIVQKLYGKQQEHAFRVPAGIQVPQSQLDAIANQEDLVLDDWVVNVQYSRYALDGASYSIRIWLGGEEAGSVYNFGSPRVENDEEKGCGSCRQAQEAGSLSLGQVLISSPLGRLVGQPGGPPSHDEAAVTAWLQQEANFHWTVTAYGQDIPLTDPCLSDLLVSVAKGKVQYYQDTAKLPDYGDYRAIPSITAGMRCGLEAHQAY